MFKKITIAVALTFMALLAKADFLYWQVTPTEGVTFSVANLYVTGTGVEGGSKLLDGVLADGVDFGSQDKLTGTTVVPTQTDISGYAGAQYSFFVELVTYSADGTVAGTQRPGCPWDYNDLVSSGYISAGGVSTPTAGMLSGGPNMASPVPEPTSGILLLVGGAMLALRRRRRA